MQNGFGDICNRNYRALYCMYVVMSVTEIIGLHIAFMW